MKSFLLFALCVSVARIAEGAEPPRKPATPVEMGAITAEQVNGAIKISIVFNPSVPSPRISRLIQPERLVFDFVNTIPKAGYRRTSVNKSSLIAIRTSLFRMDGDGRPVTRVVFDLSQRSEFQASSSAGMYNVTVFDRTGKLPSGPAHSGVQTSTAPLVTNRPEPTASKLPVVPRGENALNDISVSHDQGFTSVVLDFQQPAKPLTMRLGQPKRFVLDFSGVGLGTQSKNCSLIKADTVSLRAIRCSLFKAQPATIRIVLDETASAPRPQVSFVGASVRIQYSDQARSRIPQASLSQSTVNAVAPPKMQSEAVLKPLPGVPPQSPIVTYENGLLTIEAKNAILADVLYAISEKTGASIQLPMSNAMLDRVDLKMGPVKPSEIMATILQGSGFTYYLIEDNSGRLQKVILTPK
jgi:hypothetical protein